jgi:ubiquinone/menaquinone biosynthesis C-methylase UbiE
MSDSHQKQHYDKVAVNHGLSALSSIKDHHIREAELKYINFCLETYGHQGKSLIDLGHGNGHTLKTIREKYESIDLYGIEYHEKMYQLSCEQNIENCTLWHDDMISTEVLKKQKFDFILTERSLVNILNLKNRPKVCEQIYHGLKPGGLFIMIESFSETWIKMNEARNEFQLEAIPISHHNKYLNEDTIKIFKKKGFEEIEHSFGRHYLSTHFYITRVWHPSIRQSNAPMDNSHFSKFFTKALPPSIGEYSPIQFRLFKKTE